MSESRTNEERHRETFEAARTAVRQLDPAEIAERTATRWHETSPGRGRLEIPALGHTAKLEWPDLEFDADHPLLTTYPWRLICLHHLTQRPISAPVGDWVSYRQIPDGLFYAQAVARDVEKPLAAAFARDLAAFLDASAELGARRESIGDAGMVFHPFPLVPVLLALWAEDEEFPSEMRVLFDKEAAGNLPLQDLRIIAELIGGALQRMAPGETA